MQEDGNLVSYYRPAGIALWATATFERGSWMAMQGDGNLVVYSAGGRALWSSATENHGGSKLAVQDDGNIVVYGPDGRPLWATMAMPAQTRCGLNVDAMLRPGESVRSCNQEHMLVLQGDGNLVVYNKAGQPLWATGTRAEDGDPKKGAFAVMQSDGNFVLYNKDGQPLWATNTNGKLLSALVVNDDGTLSIVGRDGQTLWSTSPKVDVPQSLIDQLSVKPYVEQSCSPASYPGWPYEAKRCSYSAGGISTSVIVANPSPERAARWIADSANQIPALARLKNGDRGQYEEGLKAIGLAMLYQSSRIFPLSGGVIENMGSGYVNYNFEKGVTTSCGSGCYCRINSLHRSQWCDYQAAIGAQSRSACMGQVGSSGYTTGWGNQCFENHKRAWESDVNEHFRARAFIANQTVQSRCGGGCSGAQVVAAVRSAFGL